MYNAKIYYNSSEFESSTKEVIDVTCPVDGKVIGTVQKASLSDTHDCLQAAHDATKEWAALTATKRGQYVNQLADILEANKEELATILSMEHGKILSEAIGEIEGGIGFLRYANENARRIEGMITTSDYHNERTWFEKVPYGVTVGILAWNFPLALACRKIGNSLVAGNTMVVKPPTETPLTVMKFGELAMKSDLPKGVLGFITGTGREVGNALVSDKLTQLVTLTGSTGAGRQLYKAAAENITVLHLELGGKAPFIVMDDADLDKAVEAAVVSRFANCGQICTCNERMYIHENVYEEFKTRFLEGVKKIKVGPSLDPTTTMGPKVNKAEVDKLIDLVNVSVSEGGKVIYDGKDEAYTADLEAKYPNGTWCYPRVVEVYDNANILMHEETFGPIAPMMKISSFDQALEYANDCEYGLSAYLFTNNAKNIMRATRELEFGELYINRQNGEQINGFHNGFKLSGVGGEDGKYGFESYMQIKTVYMNWDIK